MAGVVVGCTVSSSMDRGAGSGGSGWVRPGALRAASLTLRLHHLLVVAVSCLFCADHSKCIVLLDLFSLVHGCSCAWTRACARRYRTQLTGREALSVILARRWEQVLCFHCFTVPFYFFLSPSDVYIGGTGRHGSDAYEQVVKGPGRMFSLPCKDVRDSEIVDLGSKA